MGQAALPAMNGHSLKRGSTERQLESPLSITEILVKGKGKETLFMRKS